MNKLIFFFAAAFIISSCSQFKTGDKNVEKGVQLYKAGDLEQARQEYMTGVVLPLNDYKLEEVYSYIGMIHHDWEDYDSAVFYYKKAIDVNPNFIDPWVNIGVSYRLMEEYDLAAESYAKAMELDPNDTELLVSLGALYVVKEEPKKAIEYLEKAIASDASILAGHSNYALALALDGRYDDAQKEVDFCESHNYENIDALKERIEETKIANDYKALGFEDKEAE